ncbi:MAG: hypothetical protein GXY34_11835 [Syntrophomonadaceae bacterium]|nr:hypothetical protein [Syntrophomonadaceae bacterium]
MKKLIICSLITALVIATCCISVYAVSPRQQANIVANDTFYQWIDLCSESWKSLGFESEDQAKQAYLGDTLWQVYQLNNNSYSSEQLLTNQLIESPLFIIPVLSDGNIITDLEVMLVNGDWKIAGIGGHICKQAIEVITLNGLKESECKIVFSPTQKFFFSYKDGEEIGLPYMNGNDSVKMTQINVKNIKEQLKQNNSINADPNLAPEQVRFGNASMFHEQKQTTSILLD